MPARSPIRATAATAAINLAVYEARPASFSAPCIPRIESPFHFHAGRSSCLQVSRPAPLLYRIGRRNTRRELLDHHYSERATDWRGVRRARAYDRDNAASVRGFPRPAQPVRRRSPGDRLPWLSWSPHRSDQQRHTRRPAHPNTQRPAAPSSDKHAQPVPLRDEAPPPQIAPPWPTATPVSGQPARRRASA